MAVVCAVCHTEGDASQMFSCKFKGQQTYECGDEAACRSKKAAQDKALKEQRTAKWGERSDKEYQMFEALSKEFPEVDANLLVKSPTMFRDASYNYRETSTDNIYSWSLFEKKWSQRNHIASYLQ